MMIVLSFLVGFYIQDIFGNMHDFKHLKIV